MSEKKRFLLRLDEKLFQALERWAADDLRSINGQIEFLLKDSLRRTGRLKAPPPEEAPGKEGRKGERE
jgi:hypothetical protein